MSCSVSPLVWNLLTMVTIHVHAAACLLACDLMTVFASTAIISSTSWRKTVVTAQTPLGPREKYFCTWHLLGIQLLALLMFSDFVCS